jgi:pullulanase/glycogen debranching enzyme
VIHQQPRTQNYVQRVIKQWVEEYKIDGFRWDLTKGFELSCERYWWTKELYR